MHEQAGTLRNIKLEVKEYILMNIEPVLEENNCTIQDIVLNALNEISNNTAIGKLLISKSKSDTQCAVDPFVEIENARQNRNS